MMNVILLLLSLLSPYLSASPQKEAAPAALYGSTSAVVPAFEHSRNISPYISSFDSLADVSLYMAMRERIDRRDVISATVLPVLLVAGAEDSKVSPERIFTSDHPNVSQVTISGVGHMH